MPRPRRTADPEDDSLAGQLDQDPIPTPARRGPGRPKGSTTRGPGKIPARTSTGRVMSKAQMESKVQGEIFTYLTLANAAFSLRDPHCSAVVEEQIPEIAARVTAMLARNETLLATVAKSGIIGDVIALLSALLPIGRAIWAAHGPNGDHHGDTPRENIDEERYQPYAGR